MYAGMGEHGTMTGKGEERGPGEASAGQTQRCEVVVKTRLACDFLMEFHVDLLPAPADLPQSPLSSNSSNSWSRVVPADQSEATKQRQMESLSASMERITAHVVIVDSQGEEVSVKSCARREMIEMWMPSSGQAYLLGSEKQKPTSSFPLVSSSRIVIALQLSTMQHAILILDI
eukprot:697478-Hanusia_phi.AAC.2